MTTRPPEPDAADDEPVNLDELKADDELVEDLRHGKTPGDRLGKLLGAWRDETQWRKR